LTQIRYTNKRGFRSQWIDVESFESRETPQGRWVPVVFVGEERSGVYSYFDRTGTLNAGDPVRAGYKLDAAFVVDSPIQNKRPFKSPIVRRG